MASTSGVRGILVPAIEAPANFWPSPSTRVFSKFTCVVEATVVSHGLLWATVEASGPELPAEAAMKTPASAAPSKATSTASTTVSVAPEME